MTLRLESARERLEVLQDAVDRLRGHLGNGRDALVLDRDLQWLVERGTHVAAEAVFDAGSHVLAAAFRAHVAEYGEILPALASRGVIAPLTARKLGGLAGLRNLLVHRYSRLDHGRLFDELVPALDGLDAVASELSAWLDAREAPSR